QSIRIVPSSLARIANAPKANAAAAKAVQLNQRSAAQGTSWLRALRSRRNPNHCNLRRRYFEVLLEKRMRNVYEHAYMLIKTGNAVNRTREKYLKPAAVRCCTGGGRSNKLIISL